MRIKYIISTVILMTVGFSMKSYGQQLEYSQYYLNLPATNPGFTGINDFLDLTAGVRQGWNDFEDQNVSAFVSAYGTLNKPMKQIIRSNALRISDPSLISKVSRNKKLRRKHGIGGYVSSKVLGPYSKTNVFLNYAYHLPVSPRLNWAMGTRVGYQSEKVDFTKYTVREGGDTFYDQLLTTSGNQSHLLIDFGSVLYTDNFYFGVSTYSIISSALGGDNILEDQTISHYQVQLGKTLPVSDKIEMSLSAAGSYTDGYDPSWVINARMKYKDIVYLGLGYEYDTRVSLLFGLTANGRYSIHYSYDKYLSGLSNFNVNSHELMVGIFIFNKYKADSKFW